MDEPIDRRDRFEKLLTEHRTVLERYVNYRMPTRFDAEDVLQETLLAAYLHFDALREPARFLPWILSIARNECRRWYRDRCGREDISLAETEETLVSPAHDADSVTARDILASLPKEEASLLLLTTEGWKQREIAERLGIPLGTVKSRLYHAKKRARAVCPPEIREFYERENRIMAKKEFLHGFPEKEPALAFVRTNAPFVPVDTADEAFIIPIVGNRNAEGTYRMGVLALVSDCFVVKRALVHEVEGVKIVRDTFNIRADRMYRNEGVWFTQLTNEYIRDLATICNDLKEEEDGEEDFPTVIYTFLEKDYDVALNGGDRIHGRPRMLRENPVPLDGTGYGEMERNVRYTDGVHDLTVGERTFRCVKSCLIHSIDVLDERYTDLTGRLVLMRTWETENSIRAYEMYSEERIAGFLRGPTITVDGKTHYLMEDRISEYAL